MKRVIFVIVALLMVITLTPINGVVAQVANSQKIYGIERDTGKIYEIDPDTASITEFFQTSVSPTDTVSPNGLAYDYDNTRLYYVTYGEPAELYYTDGSSQTYAGQLIGEIASASFYDEKYYYIAGGPLGATDDLHEVVLDETTGMVVSDTKIDDITDGDHAWTFEGDIAISSAGVIYGQGLCAIDGLYEFFSVNPDGSKWTLINSTYTHSLQLAFGADGTLYGHDAYSGDFFEVDITNGSLTYLSNSTMFTDLASGPGPQQEPGQGRWTGGGTIGTGAITPAGVRVTHGFEFHNDLDKPNNLEVNWGGNRFHMTELLAAKCWMNDKLPPPDPPVAPVNEVEGTGVGRYNGVDGYTVFFDFTDVGEPGLNDYAYIKITASDGTVVLEVEGTLTKGNHQAHKDNK